MPETATLPPAAANAVTRSLLVVARSSITAAADRELEQVCVRLRERHPACDVRYAYTEQGEPALRTVLHRLADDGFAEVLLLPLLVPLEPGFGLSLQRVVKRWRQERGGEHGQGSHAHWPVLRIAPAPSSLPAIEDLLDAMAEAAAQASATNGERAPDAEGATVPTQRWRVLMCAGQPCSDAGAALLWGHLRNIQKSRNLRTEGPGVMACKTSCLGPCGLAPVLQVWPDGTWYGGVDEPTIERIVDEHLLDGRPVADSTYAVQPGKQWLRRAASASLKRGDPAGAGP